MSLSITTAINYHSSAQLTALALPPASIESLPHQKVLIWSKLNKPTHPDVIALVEKHAASLLAWKSDAFDKEYRILEEHLLTTLDLRKYINTTGNYCDSGHHHFTRVNAHLSLLRDAMYNKQNWLNHLKLQEEEAKKKKEQAIRIAAAKKAAEEAAEEEREARRRLAVIEWEAGRAAREEAQRVAEEAKRLAAEEKEARILAKMEELSKK